MRMLMNRSNLTSAACATILAAALLPGASACEALAAGGAERAAAPRGERDVQYIVVELGLPVYWKSARPYAMNEQGQIVGEGRLGSGDRGFLWEDGEMTYLFGFEAAYDINNSGVIVGYSTGEDHALVWVDGEVIDLGEGRAYAINDAGRIVGWARVGGDKHAVIGDVTGWQIDLGDHWPGVESQATAINEEGIVAGWTYVGSGWLDHCEAHDAFTWDGDEITLLWELPPYYSEHYIPRDINERCCVVGERRYWWYMNCAGYDWEAWEWYAGEGVVLPTPDPLCDFHAAFAINDVGDAVGRAHDDYDYYDCGALWRDGVAYDLNDLVDPESPWHIEAAYDIDNRGRIAAFEYPQPLLLIPIKPGDIDGDGDVDTADLLALLAAWGPCEGCPEDIDGNGVVNTADLLILLANWG